VATAALQLTSSGAAASVSCRLLTATASPVPPALLHVVCCNGRWWGRLPQRAFERAAGRGGHCSGVVGVQGKPRHFFTHGWQILPHPSYPSRPSLPLCSFGVLMEQLVSRKPHMRRGEWCLSQAPEGCPQVRPPASQPASGQSGAPNCRPALCACSACVLAVALPPTCPFPRSIAAHAACTPSRVHAPMLLPLLPPAAPERGQADSGVPGTRPAAAPHRHSRQGEAAGCTSRTSACRPAVIHSYSSAVACKAHRLSSMLVLI